MPSSKADSTFGEDDGSSPSHSNCNHPPAENNAVWGEWWKAEELAEKVGSLSKELTELKVMVSRHSADDEASDVSGAAVFIYGLRLI